MALIVILTSAILFWNTAPAVNEVRYAELEKVFRERSQIKQQEHAAIMARYTPTVDYPAEKPAVKVNEEELNVKTFEIPEPEQGFADTIRININKATAKELQQLPGIGPAYSRRIVEWRDEHGKFIRVDQLLDIRGIGPVRLEKIKPMIVL